MAFGELSFSAVQDLGSLGAEEGPAVVVQRSALPAAMALVPWLLLLLLFLGDRSNRSRSAAAALLAFVVTAGLWSLFSRVGPLRMIADAAGSAGDVPVALAFGLAVVWLRAHRFAASSNAAAWGRFLAWTVGAGVLWLGAQSGGDLTASLGWAALTALIGAGIVTGGLAAAARINRRRGGRASFAAIACGLIWAGTVVVMIPVAVIILLSNGGGMREMVFAILLGVMVSGGMLGGLLAGLVAMPFVVTACAASLYRARFDALFHLTRMPAVPPALPGPASPADVPVLRG